MHATPLACEVLRYWQLQADVSLAASLVLLCLCVKFAPDSLTSRSIVAMYRVAQSMQLELLMK